MDLDALVKGAQDAAADLSCRLAAAHVEHFPAEERIFRFFYDANGRRVMAGIFLGPVENAMHGDELRTWARRELVASLSQDPPTT